MKKTILFIMLLVLGICCLAGSSGNDELFTQKTYTADGTQINKINIDVRDREIEVSRSNDNQIHIDYFENSKEYYDISVSDSNALTMTAANNKEWTDYIGAKSAASARKISLQLPDALLTELKISTTNTNISLAALTVAGDVSLTANGGDISFDGLNAETSLTINSKNGDISGMISGSYDDFAISCDIKKGKSNLPSDKKNGTKALNVSNNNGDIDIAFMGE